MSRLSVPWHIACYVYQVCQDSVTLIALCYDVCGNHCGIATDRMWCRVVRQAVPDFQRIVVPSSSGSCSPKGQLFLSSFVTKLFWCLTSLLQSPYFHFCTCAVLKTSDSLVHLSITFNIQLLYTVCATECFSLNGMFARYIYIYFSTNSCHWDKKWQGFNEYVLCLTLNLLTTTIVAPPSNASKWQMGFNLAFKGLTVE
jgi:hypothetical protein